MYDPQLGRFFGIDPIIEKFYYLTPYNYASNNPTSMIDLWGLQGAYTVSGNDMIFNFTNARVQNGEITPQEGANYLFKCATNPLAGGVAIFGAPYVLPIAQEVITSFGSVLITPYAEYLYVAEESGTISEIVGAWIVNHPKEAGILWGVFLAAINTGPDAPVSPVPGSELYSQFTSYIFQLSIAAYNEISDDANISTNRLVNKKDKTRVNVPKADKKVLDAIDKLNNSSKSGAKACADCEKKKMQDMYDEYLTTTTPNNAMTFKQFQNMQREPDKNNRTFR